MRTVGMRTWLVCCGLIGLVLVTPAWATVDIQYSLASQLVVAVSDVPLDSVSDFGIVTLVGSVAADIIWPIPSGCAAGTGKPEWTHLIDPGLVEVDGTSMEVRSDLLVFTTTSTLLPGCWEISSVIQLRALVNSTLESAMFAGNPLPVSEKMNIAVQGICPPCDGSTCPPSGESASCPTLRTAIATWNAVPGGAAADMVLFMVQAQLLKDEAATFATAQGWSL